MRMPLPPAAPCNLPTETTWNSNAQCPWTQSTPSPPSQRIPTRQQTTYQVLCAVVTARARCHFVQATTTMRRKRRAWKLVHCAKVQRYAWAGWVEPRWRLGDVVVGYFRPNIFKPGTVAASTYYVGCNGN